MAKSLPRFESNWKLVEISENWNPEKAPANINNLKTICQEEWYEIHSNYYKKLIENYWKRLVTVEVNEGYSPKYKMKITRYFLYCTMNFFTYDNE